MSHDDVDLVLDLVRERDITVKDESAKNLTLDLVLNPTVFVKNIVTDFIVVIDTESMGSEVPDTGVKIHRSIIFTKIVKATKKTFASLKFDITNNRQTVGTVITNPASHNFVQRIFTFNKAVSAKRTTFGKTSLAVTNNIQTAGINHIGDISFYGGGIYGNGTYVGSVGYGSGLYGFGPYSGIGISFPIRFGSVISGSVPYKQTAVAQISLASHGVPISDANHSIVIRARTVSGSSGVIKAALYEGANNRSGDLQTLVLTNTFDKYTLQIPEAAVATITDYSNLSIKFWGYDLSGNPIVFQISEIYLELPITTGSVQYGIVSRQITFGKSVSGSLSSKTTPTAEVSLGSHNIPSARTNHTIKVRARTVSGSTGVLKAALYEGVNNRSGDLITPPLSNTLTDYTLVILDPSADTIIDYSNLSIRFWGFDIAGNNLVFEVARLYLELPSSIGNTTQYGVVSRAITFTKDVSGVVGSKKTSTAEISLATHSVPSERTNHRIKVRARTTSGSTGVIKAELYQGTTLRSDGTLTTLPLTNILADYVLLISDAAAATITDYSNLSIKFWGYDPNGNPLVFEIANIYLELPTAAGGTTHYGAVSRVTTFNKSVSGVIASKRTSTAEISLASHGTPSARTNHSIKVRARTTSGSTGVLKAELYEGATLRSGGTLTTPSLTNSLADYTLAVPDASAATISSYSNLSIKIWGFDSAGNALVFEVARLYLELPTP